MDSLDKFMKMPAPTALRPLLGQTVLAVEDSRFTCEAIRLVCLKSGARIRRADSLTSARRHLSVFHPSVVLVDVGLPDGSGGELIEELARANPRPQVILGMSGDDSMADTAIAAGADAFLAKPIASLAGFQQAVLSHLPADRQPSGPRAIKDDAITPDAIAYQDDLAHAREALSGGAAEYAAQFVESLATCGDNPRLLQQAKRLRWNPDSAEEQAALAAMLTERMGDRLAV